MRELVPRTSSTVSTCSSVSRWSKAERTSRLFLTLSPTQSAVSALRPAVCLCVVLQLHHLLIYQKEEERKQKSESALFNKVSDLKNRLLRIKFRPEETWSWVSTHSQMNDPIQSIAKVIAQVEAEWYHITKLFSIDKKKSESEWNLFLNSKNIPTRRERNLEIKPTLSRLLLSRQLSHTNRIQQQQQKQVFFFNVIVYRWERTPHGLGLL